MATKNETPAEADKEEAEGADAKDAAAPKRRFSLKLIIMVAGGVVGLCALGGGGYFFFGHHGNTAAAATTIKPPIFVDMPDVLVNLSSSGGDRTQYLKVKIALELPDEAVHGADPADHAAAPRHVPNLPARIAADRSRRLGRPLSAQGGADAARQCLDRAEPDQRRAVQGNRGAVRGKTLTLKE